MKKTDMAYLAGFFDGEGCINITGHNRGHYQLHINVSQANKWILWRYKMAFGGKIYEYVNLPSSRRRAWQWNVSAKVAGEFLKAIYPYLILKQAEAKVAIEFQEAMSTHRGGRAKKQTPEELAIQEAQRLLLHNLKNKSNY